MSVNDTCRERFDQLVAEAIENLPDSLRDLIDEVPVIVLDEPTEEMLRDLGMKAEEAAELCGLHSGTPFTEPGLDRADHAASSASPAIASIHLFRRGILHLALDNPGHPSSASLPEWPDTDAADDAVYSEIEVTLLHEIGHQFGLDEDDLERLGYD